MGRNARRSIRSNNQHLCLDVYSNCTAFYSINHLVKLFETSRTTIHRHRELGLLSPYREFYLDSYDVLNAQRELVRQQERACYEFPAPTVLAYSRTLWNIRNKDKQQFLNDSLSLYTELPTHEALQVLKAHENRSLLEWPFLIESAQYYCENYNNNFEPREVPLSTTSDRLTTIDFNGARSYTFDEYSSLSLEHTRKVSKERKAARESLTPEDKAAIEAAKKTYTPEEIAEREERIRLKMAKAYDDYYNSIEHGKPQPLRFR